MSNPNITSNLTYTGSKITQIEEIYMNDVNIFQKRVVTTLSYTGDNITSVEEKEYWF